MQSTDFHLVLNCNIITVLLKRHHSLCMMQGIYGFFYQSDYQLVSHHKSNSGSSSQWVLYYGRPSSRLIPLCQATKASQYSCSQVSTPDHRIQTCNNGNYYAHCIISYYKYYACSIATRVNSLQLIRHTPYHWHVQNASVGCSKPIYSHYIWHETR